MRNISSLLSKFLFVVDIFFCPYSSISPSIEFDFLTEVVSTVDTPIKSQKYSAVKISVIPHTNSCISITYYFI